MQKDLASRAKLQIQLLVSMLFLPNLILQKMLALILARISLQVSMEQIKWSLVQRTFMTRAAISGIKTVILQQQTPDLS